MLARMSLAVLVQRKGFGSALLASMYALMAFSRLATERNNPRLRAQFGQQREEAFHLRHSRLLASGRKNVNDLSIRTLGPVYIHRVQRKVATRLIMAAKQVSVFS